MGTSYAPARYMTVVWDHPHAYGDKQEPSQIGCKIAGSSPRVWGQASSLKKTHAPCGIIPTRMGTSIEVASQKSCERDHPHAYGDKSDFDSDVSDGQGSSPRVWGQDGLV